HARGVSPLRGDLAGGGADGNASRGDEEELVVEADHEGGDHVAATSGQLDPLDAHRSTALAREAFELGALAVAGVGDEQDVDLVAGHVAGHDLVARLHAHADDALGGAPGWTHLLLGEANGLAVAADHEDVVVAAGLDDADELVLGLEV